MNRVVASRISGLPRALALAVFRIHIENGITVAFGVGLVGVVVGMAAGLDTGVSAATGALCVSICDHPDPLRQKPLILGLALVSACFFTALSSWTAASPILFVPATAIAGLLAGFVSPYGRRALSLGMTGALAYVYAVGAAHAGNIEIWHHLFLFTGGAIFYAGYALGVARLFDDRTRRLLIAEAIRAFVGYLRAKAVLCDPESDAPRAFRTLIDAHTELAERLQAARDALYARRQNPLQLRRIDTLIALLDAFETVLSSDADIEILRRSRHHELLRRLGTLTSLIADEVERLTLALRTSIASPTPHRHEAEYRSIEAEIDGLAAAAGDEEETLAIASFRATFNKLAYADRHVANLARALDPRTPPSEIATKLDLEAFRGPRSIRYLKGQWSLDAPALRYAIRLSLAMTAGLLLTLALPGFAHGSWVLLTIALVMRANYSVSAQRRWDRVTGTLVGCLVAALLLRWLPTPVLLAIIVLSIGISHAYTLVRYRITAISASVTALVLLHFEAPFAHPPFYERITDTLIGAGMAYFFGFILPNWERHDLPRTVAALLAADAGFAEAALTRSPVRQRYRLGRKRALDAVAGLSNAIRRLADEPHTDRRALAALNQLLAANYLFASDLSSMPVLMRLREGELDAGKSDEMIEATRARVLHVLKNPSEAEPVKTHMDRRGLSALKSYEAMSVLERRLAHIERTACRVAQLAAQPLI